MKFYSATVTDLPNLHLTSTPSLYLPLPISEIGLSKTSTRAAQSHATFQHGAESSHVTYEISSFPCVGPFALSTQISPSLSRNSVPQLPYPSTFFLNAPSRRAFVFGGPFPHHITLGNRLFTRFL